MRTFTGMLALAASFAICGQAGAEVFFEDDVMQLSGSGVRTSRTCILALKPVAVLGGENAPRLALTLSGQSRMVLGLSNSRQYRTPALVQGNVRKPFLGVDITSPEDLRTYDAAKALRSKRPFFVTARLESGAYVSSRYERLDLDVMLGKIEEHCPFDAENLMLDVSSRERRERSLSVSPSELTSIRWALNKRYGFSSSEPEWRSSLTQTERGYLKRYAADNGMPLTQYLTSDIARRLISEGQSVARLAAPPPPPPPPPPKYYNAVAAGTWLDRGKARVATGYSGLRSSSWEAEESAVEACRNASGRNCRSTGSWDSGCIYITVGSKRSQVGWVARTTVDETLRDCRAKGYTCKPPIGGCVD